MSVLEAAGLVSGAPDPADGRQTIWSLTVACRKMIKDSRTAREDWLYRAVLAKVPADRYQKASQIGAELKKLEHATGSGALAQIENAWSLVQAKHAAKRKTKMPLLVSILCLVSILSVASSLSMVYFKREFRSNYARLDRANIASAQFFRCYVQLTRISKFGQVYLFNGKPEWLRQMDLTHADINREFDETEVLLAQEPAIRDRYRKLRAAFENALRAFNAKLDLRYPVRHIERCCSRDSAHFRNAAKSTIAKTE